MKDILEGIYAYADGDNLCRYSEDADNNDLSFLRSPGVGRYVSLAYFDERFGFLYNYGQQTYLNGESKDPENDYSVCAYAHRILRGRHVLEVHKMRSEVRYDPNFPRGTKELDHFMTFLGLLPSYSSDILSSARMAENNDLPAWKFGEAKNDLPALQVMGFSTTEYDVNQFLQQRFLFLAFTEAYARAMAQGQSLVVTYPIDEYDVFVRFLFNWLRFFPLQVSSNITFLTMAGFNDQSQILGVPYKGEIDETILQEALPNTYVFHFSSNVIFRLDEHTTSLTRSLYACVNLEAFSAFRARLMQNKDRLQTFAMVQGFAAVWLLETEAVQDSRDAFTVLNYQSRLLHGLFDNRDVIEDMFLPASAPSFVDKLQRFNIASCDNYHQVDVKVRMEFFDIAFELSKNWHNDDMRESTVQHMIRLILPEQNQGPNNSDAFAETFMNCYENKREFFEQTFFPRFYDQERLHARFDLMSRRQPKTFARFYVDYVLYLQTRMPHSRNMFFDYIKRLYDLRGPNVVSDYLLAMNNHPIEETFGYLCDFYQSSDSAVRGGIENLLLQNYQGENRADLLRILENNRSSVLYENLFVRALQGYLGLPLSHVALSNVHALIQRARVINYPEAYALAVAEAKKPELVKDAASIGLDTFIKSNPNMLDGVIEFLREQNQDTKELDEVRANYERELRAREDAQALTLMLESSRLKFTCKTLRTLPRRTIRSILIKHLGRERFAQLMREMTGSVDERMDAIIEKIITQEIPLKEMEEWWNFGVDVYEEKVKKHFHLSNIVYQFRNLFLSTCIGLGGFAASFAGGLACYHLLLNDTYYFLFFIIALLTGAAGFFITFANCKDVKSRARIITVSILETVVITVLLLGAFIGMFYLVR